MECWNVGIMERPNMEVRDILNIIKQINPFFVFSKLRAFVVGFPYLSLLCLCYLRATKTVNSFYSLAHFSQTSLRRVSPNPLMGSRNKNSGILDLRIDQFPNPSIRNPLICHYRFRLKAVFGNSRVDSPIPQSPNSSIPQSPNSSIP